MGLVMLHIYRDKEDIPENIKYIRDNLDYFRKVTIPKINKRVNGLLKNTDNVQYIDGATCLDRFGARMPWTGLSMGGMTVLNVFYNLDCCFDLLECGYNARTDIKNLRQGNIYQGGLSNIDNIDEIDIIYDDNEDFHYTSYKGIGE